MGRFAQERFNYGALRATNGRKNHSLNEERDIRDNRAADVRSSFNE